MTVTVSKLGQINCDFLWKATLAIFPPKPLYITRVTDSLSCQMLCVCRVHSLGLTSLQNVKMRSPCWKRLIWYENFLSSLNEM